MAANDVNIRIKAVDDTEKAFRSVKTSLGGLKNAVFSVQGAIATLAGGFALRGIVDANRSFQSLQASLITFTGSAQEAAKQFAVLQEFAATTPFSLQEVVGGFNKLIARGIDPSIDSLTAFGNIASGTGKSLDQFIEAVADAAVGEFERLKEFGIKANTEGDKIKLTFGGVTQTIGKNSEEILDYLEQLGNAKFAGAIERQAKTLNGAFSNLGDSLDALSVSIGEAGLNKFLIDVSRNASQATNALTGMIKRFSEGSSFSEIFGGKIGAAASELTSAKAALDNWNARLALYGQNEKIVNGVAEAQERYNRALFAFRGQDTSALPMVPLVELPESKVKPATESSEAKKARESYAKQLSDQRSELASLMTVEETRARQGIAGMYALRDASNESGKAFRNAYAAAKDLRENVGTAEMVAISETIQGMKTPLEQFSDGIKNVEDSMQQMALRGLSQLEDGLVGLVNGTKSASDAFSDMARSIINDMIRIVIQQQITGPLANALSSGISSAFGGTPAPAKAIGGPVQAGKTTLVGERGPELFIPSASGSIVPNNSMGGGNGVTVVQNISVTTGVQQTVRAEIMNLMPQIANAAKSAVADAKLRGGSYAAALR